LVFALTIWMDLTLIAVVLGFAVILALVAARQGAAGVAEVSGKKRMRPRNFRLAVLPWCFGVFLLANLLADVPFLISVYGFGRMWNERLYIVEKVHGGGPWFVSNGDRLIDGLYVQYLFAMAIFVGLIVVSMFLAGRYLARK